MPYWPTKERNEHPLSTSTRGVFWRRLGWENSLLSGYLTLWKIHSPHKWMERANWRHWVFEPQVLKMGSVRRRTHMAQHSTQPQSSTIPMISFKASNRLLPSARKIEPWHDWTKHATFLPTSFLRLSRSTTLFFWASGNSHFARCTASLLRRFWNPPLFVIFGPSTVRV